MQHSEPAPHASLLTSRPCPVCLCGWLCKSLLQHLLLQAHFSGTHTYLLSDVSRGPSRGDPHLAGAARSGGLNDHFCGAHPHSPGTLTSTSREATGREGTGPQSLSQSSTPGAPSRGRRDSPRSDLRLGRVALPADAPAAFPRFPADL